jgi:N-methylhydantoinase B
LYVEGATVSETIELQVATSQIGVDPITFAIVRHALTAIGREMTAALERSARSPFIALQRDHSCSVYDGAGRLLNLEDALPVHSVGGNLNIFEIMRLFEGDINDGDCFLVNHPFYGTTHVGDLTAIVPVFDGDERLFWAVARAHQQNTGDGYPGLTATNIYQEGIKVPPVKIVDRGTERHDVIRFYLENVRLPDWLHGDLLAMIGSARVAEKRLKELTARFGRDEILRQIEAIMDYADRRTAAEIASMPDGSWVGEGWADSDGTGNFNIYVRATVTIAGDQVFIDFSGSSEQVDGAINSSYGSMLANAAMGVLSCIDPSIPHNDGCLRHLHITAPEGSIANATWPAATAWCTVLIGDVLSEAVWKAMLQAVPDRAPAGWGRWNSSNASTAGADVRFDRPRPYMSSVMAGGSAGGATKGHDGWPLMQTACSLGAMKAESIEMRELLFPNLVETAEFETDSAGQGQWVGGYGITLKLRPVGTAMRVTGGGDGHLNPPYGAWGGSPGLGGGAWVEHPDGTRTFYVGKGMAVIVQPDELWCTLSTGGGGWGIPLDRDPELVRDGVRGDKISLRSAREDFGVVLDRDTLEIDIAATEELRTILRASRPIEPYSPTTSGAGDWVEQQLTERDSVRRETVPSYLNKEIAIEVR